MQLGQPLNRTNQEEKSPRNLSVTQPIQTTSINRTNASTESTTPTIPTVRSTRRLENLSHTTTLRDSGLIITSRPTLEHLMVSGNDSASPQAHGGNKQSKQVTLLSVLLALAVSLSAVGVVVAVFFVRWKRIKKMKKGFQEEMATICLHDELASEALYSSWKPFMDTNNSNKMKLVIEPPNQGVQSSQAET